MAILVADDDPTFLDSLAGFLRAAGHEVAVAPDGGEALAICRGERVDLLVADWIMPGTGGAELCRTPKADAALRYRYRLVLLNSARASA
ncbi:MAG TPA: response regulator [Candidatus Acidoferrum sp.]|nr:response regulator [Candidatus Acidoferrum sp.]